MEIAGTGAATHGKGKATTLLQDIPPGHLGSAMCIWNRSRFQPKIIEGTLGQEVLYAI